jgi:hypothetical protein
LLKDTSEVSFGQPARVGGRHRQFEFLDHGTLAVAEVCLPKVDLEIFENLNQCSEDIGLPGGGEPDLGESGMDVVGSSRDAGEEHLSIIGARENPARGFRQQDDAHRRLQMMDHVDCGRGVVHTD